MGVTGADTETETGSTRTLQCQRGRQGQRRDRDREIDRDIDRDGLYITYVLVLAIGGGRHIVKGNLQKHRRN